MNYFLIQLKLAITQNYELLVALFKIEKVDVRNVFLSEAFCLKLSERGWGSLFT